MSGMQWLRTGLIAVVGAAYLWLGHQASISSDPPLLSLLIGLAPLSVSALLLAWASRSPWLLGLCVVALLAMLLKLDYLRANTAWVYFIQHAGMHAMLGVMFGRTLGHDHSAALCSQVSRVVYGNDLDAAFYLYTWRVTVVWTAYFALTTLLSVLLFWLGPLAWWSVFANLLTPVIIGAIFVIEFAIRQRTLPRNRHASIAQTIKAYREYSQRKQ
ncbi:hypothetical protein [Uliginosibacterium sp. TH139]|uniref:COG4648 family protein n=1 Tax=Uliginosibacterium sp. TH139 TaxID=2067453 RepID=UPI000C7B85A2|nr:hypothetical protein [Uliginosibacterium sp. TH139]PLK47904.1 hypothetical protein C0V76_14110 [Uliginosibacterium sp. TH139]